MQCQAAAGTRLSLSVPTFHCVMAPKWGAELTPPARPCGRLAGMLTWYVEQQDASRFASFEAEPAMSCVCIAWLWDCGIRASRCAVPQSLSHGTKPCPSLNSEEHSQGIPLGTSLQGQAWGVCQASSSTGVLRCGIQPVLGGLGAAGDLLWVCALWL